MTSVSLYCRVSTQEQAERQTVENQLYSLRNYAKVYGLTIIAEYIDNGVSGTIPLDQRPAGIELLRDASNKAFSRVLIWRLDRLGRRLKYILEAHEQLEALGIGLESAMDHFDTSTANGRFFFQLLGSVAELERETIRERTVSGRDRAARAGRWTGGPIPFGYDIVDGSLVPSQRVIATLNLTEADIVRQVYQRVADGSTTVAETRYLAAMQVPAVRRYAGGKELQISAGWGVSRVNGMLHNPLYAGTHTLASRNGDIEREIPPLVPLSLWERVQEALTENRDLSSKNAKHFYTLRGLLNCAECGRRYIGFMRQRTGYSTAYYRCGGQIPTTAPLRAQRCRATVVQCTAAESWAWEQCKEAILNPHKMHDTETAIAARSEQVTATNDQRQHLQAALDESETQRGKVLRLYRTGSITQSECEVELTAIKSEADEVRKLLRAIANRAEIEAAHRAQVADMAERLREYQERLDDIEADPEWQAQIVRLLVKRIVVHSIREPGKRNSTRFDVEWAL